MKKEERTLYCRAIEKWGNEAQIDMVIEEMAGLIQTLCKSKRGLKPKMWIYNIYEELADVEIMLDQLKLILDGENMVEVYKYQIMDRLRDRLESGDEEEG